MTFQEISEALVYTAKDEGLTVTYSYDNPVVHKGLRSMRLVVNGDCNLSFYFKDFLYEPPLDIVTETDLDKALSRGLDFIYE